LLPKGIKIKIQRITFLPVVLSECETWSLTLREEHRLRVLQNSVPKNMFGPKTAELTRVRKKQHNEEFPDLKHLLDIIRAMKSIRRR
jgi:hypothetical protein